MDNSGLILARFGLGAAPDELAKAGRDPVGYLLAPLMEKGAGAAYQLSGDGLARSAENMAAMRLARDMKDAPDSQKGSKPGPVSQKIYLREIQARFQAYAQTQAPFAERLALFWANHFAVSARIPDVKAIAGSYEREAIRAHLNGHYSAMLLAVEQHPAMLIYLDNIQSSGPNSRAGKKNSRGLNENLAREILELHTLGVDGGYSQSDIIELAKAITGWSVHGVDAKNGAEPGTFAFRANAHEPGGRTIMGQAYAEAKGTAQGEAILQDLARMPQTARHICHRLAAYFVSDTPSQALVAAMAKTFIETDGLLPEVYHTMLTHEDALQTAAPKFKTPQHFLASTIRLLNPEPGSKFLRNGLQTMGQAMWSPASPKGWDQDAASWATGSGLKTRTEFAIAVSGTVPARVPPLELAVQALGPRLTDETKTALKRAADIRQATAILLMSPEFQRC